MYQRYVKRLLDIILSLAAIILLSPLFLVLAVLVRRRLGSPVLFHQKRPGRYGKVFELTKFRSMSDARDKEGNLLPDDERLTGFGKKLRSTSLDELPELFNILKGDMSIVGPRPLRVRYLPWYTDEEMHRHDVRPGLTGLAQINGRNAIGWEDRFRYDLEYVRHVSFLTDLKIIGGTIGPVFHHSGISFGEDQTVTDFDVYRKEQGMQPRHDRLPEEYRNEQ